MSLTSALRNSFVAGLILLAPLVVTVYVLWLVYGFLIQFIDPIAQGTNLANYTANVELVTQTVTLLLILATITVVGFLAQHRHGRRVFGSAGRVVTLIPLVRTIYTSVRQMANSVSSSDNAYEQLVLVEFPRRDVYTIGLVTAESPRAVENVAGGDVYNVFLPSSPNPASGRLVLVPAEDVHEVDMSVRQGMRLLMTTGMGGTTEDDEFPLPPVEDLPDDGVTTDGR